MNKNTFSKILILSIFITCGLLISANAQAVNYQKAETNYSLFYYPNDWDLIISANIIPDNLSPTFPSSLFAVKSENYTTPAGDDGEAQVALSVYDNDNKKLKKWFKKYKKEDISSGKAVFNKKKSKKIFYYKNKYIVKEPETGNILRYYYIKQGKRIYEASIITSSLDKGKNFKKGLKVLKSMVIY